MFCSPLPHKVLPPDMHLLPANFLNQKLFGASELTQFQRNDECFRNHYIFNAMAETHANCSANWHTINVQLT